jgi:hypothetical protein
LQAFETNYFAHQYLPEWQDILEPWFSLSLRWERGARAVPIHPRRMETKQFFYFYHG